MRFFLIFHELQVQKVNAKAKVNKRIA